MIKNLNKMTEKKALTINHHRVNMSSFNTCQCCLAQGCTKDIFTEYYCNGHKEIYSEMLLNTLNVNILQNASNKICEQCIGDLRHATEFKFKVLNSRSHMEHTSLKLENDNRYYNDFDDKISVDFNEDCAPTGDMENNDKGQFFIIELVQRNDGHHKQSQLLQGDTGVIDEEPSLKKINRCLRKSKINNDKSQRGLKPKIKQPESQNHKDLKENSLKLVFNSNLCLFKSLKTKFGCFICNEAFFTIKELRLHSKIHSNVEIIRAKFNRLRGLSYHNADISSLKCTKCDESCFDLSELKKHLIVNHGVKFGQDAGNFLIPYKLEDSFDCVVCNEKFNTYMRLSMHMNQHYSNNVCEICGSSFINRISLRIHLHSRHREKKCSLCSETFITNYARVRHMRSHHNSCLSKRYCLICGKTFRYTYQLVEHRIQDHGVKRQLSKCSLCPKTFPNAQNLKIHVRSVHVRERNFPCLMCEMRFFTKFDQKRHEKTHVDVRSFACNYCESKFKGKDSLRRHLKRQHGHVGT